MSPSKSDYEFRQESTMSQQLADIIGDYVDLAGSDPKTSRKIQRLKNCVKLGLIDKKSAEPILLFLNGDRMASFATSEKLSDITKLGLQMPKSPKMYGLDKDE